MTIGERIKQARKELGLSQKELADRAGTDRTMIPKYERGQVDIPIERLRAVAAALKKPMAWFVEEDEEDAERLTPAARALDEAARTGSALTPRQLDALHEFFMEFKRSAGERRTVGRADMVRLKPQEREAALGELASPAKIRPLPRLKVEQKAAAGRADFVDVPPEYLELAQHRWHRGYRPFRITGDSMAPFILDGDYVVVDISREPADGDTVLARTSDGLIVKRFYLRKDHVELVSVNPEYRPIKLREVAILGVLVDIVRPVKKIVEG